MKKLLILSSVFMVLSCAALGYKWYGVDTGNVSSSNLKSIHLISGEKKNNDKTMVDCKTERDDDTPKCIVVPASDFRAMRQEILECRSK